MRPDLYLSLGGDTVINASATRAYLENGVRPASMSLLDCCEPCAGLAGIVGDPSYQLPETDPAPWYDESGAAPESADFAGLVVEDVQLSSPVQGRPFSENVGTGATFGRVRLGGRTLTVTGWLAGRTCCATAYGLRWLQAALMPACIDDRSCNGAEACFLTCCPSNDTPEGALEVCVDEAEQCDDYTGDPIFDYGCRDDQPSEFQRADDFWRRMINVGLLDGPNVVERVGLPGDCGCTEVLRVEFTLGIGTPWLFENPAPCLENVTASPCTGPTLPPIPPDQLPECPEFPDPTSDPLCPPPRKPPAIPVPANPCVEIPQSFDRVFCDIASPAGGDWFDATTIVEVHAGGSPLRGLVVRMWDNPQQLECGDPFFTDCNACSSLYVSYVPAGGMLRVDGTTRRNTITQGLTTVDASPSLFTVEGRPFTPLDLSCRRACIAIDFPCDASSDASASAWVVRRALW